jgi:hypothetical protein
MSEIKLAPWIVPYKNRRRFCRKVRDTEREVQQLKDEKKWKEAARLQYVLRNAWWGYKRYK